MTLKEKAFIQETAKTLNPTKAVERVYDIGGKGGSKTKAQAKSTATSMANENLTKPDIKEAMKPIIEQLEVKRQMAIDRLTARKLDSALARDTTAIIDTLTKNIQLLGGGETERARLNITFDKSFDKKPKE